MSALPQLQSKTLFTIEEYLAFEREAEERHEYLDGVLYAMAGESPTHGYFDQHNYRSRYPA